MELGGKLQVPFCALVCAILRCQFPLVRNGRCAIDGPLGRCVSLWWGAEGGGGPVTTSEPLQKRLMQKNAERHTGVPDLVK